MYESPIQLIASDIQTTYENECLKVVQSFGFDVDKKELEKALLYDRGQYVKGYNDGYNDAIDEVYEILKEEYYYGFRTPFDSKQSLVDMIINGFFNKLNELKNQNNGNK